MRYIIWKFDTKSPFDLIVSDVVASLTIFFRSPKISLIQYAATIIGRYLCSRAQLASDINQIKGYKFNQSFGRARSAVMCVFLVYDINIVHTINQIVGFCACAVLYHKAIYKCTIRIHNENRKTSSIFSHWTRRYCTDRATSRNTW